jgi:hypothetical protein
VSVTFDRRQLRRVTAVALTVLFLSGGCGVAPLDEAVPELGTRLSQVDRAVADRRYADARTLLDDLVDVTVRARDTGAMDAAHADRILAAATRLLWALPRPQRRTDLAPETPDAGPVAGDTGVGGREQRRDDAPAPPPSGQEQGSREGAAPGDDHTEVPAGGDPKADRVTGNEGKPKKDERAAKARGRGAPSR